MRRNVVTVSRDEREKRRRGEVLRVRERERRGRERNREEEKRGTERGGIEK
jgi:hypothetical protein